MSQSQRFLTLCSIPSLRLGVLASALAALTVAVSIYPNHFTTAATAADVKPSVGKNQLTKDGMGIFNDIYEPSAVLQLEDGRVLLVEDEEHRAMNILTIADNGSLIENKASNLRLTEGFERKLDDLEGLSADHKGFIYATTSHSSLKNGKRVANREQLLRFRVKGDDVADIATITTLRDDLANSKALSAAIKKQTNQEPNFDTLNIEGLTYHPKTHELMLGLRAPMASESAIIVSITNPDAVFDKKAAPEFAAPIFLNLGGGGIRSLHFSSALNKFVIANEVTNDKGKDRSKIWTWSGNPKDAPIGMHLPELSDLKNIEGIDSINVNGVEKLLFTADEGNEKKNKPAKYRFIDEAKFQ